MQKRTKYLYYSIIFFTLFISIYSLLILDLVETFFAITSFLMILLAISRYYFGSPTYNTNRPIAEQDDYPMISIHLAICNEPPEIVIDTLKAALNVDYPNYEIIVLDNNTLKEELWEPVAKFCEGYSNIIKFKHFDHLDGFKAGALNECLKITDPSTDFILTIDADYQLKSDSLKIALAEFRGNDLAVLQFPQHYKYHPSQSGLFRELEHFFRLYASSGNRTCSTLPTGTLTFISKSALTNVGGWPEETLTEDARLGLELLQHDYRLKFSNKKIGSGIMPLSINDLRKQRHRWSYGNAQCFSMLFDMKMSLASRISVFFQLLSWINLLAIPVLGVFLYVGLVIFKPAIEYENLGSLILLQFGIYVTGKFFLLLKGSNRKTILNDLKAYFIHLALSFEMAFSCWFAFFRIPQNFIRTNKTHSNTELSSLPVFIPAVLGLLALISFYQNDYLNVTIALVFCSLFLFSSFYMYREFQPAKRKPQTELKTITP